jgi:hypothetical protein
MKKEKLNYYQIEVTFFAILNLLDITLTEISIKVVGAREANPVMALFISHSIWAALAAKLFIIMLVAGICWHLWERLLVRQILIIGNLILLLVVFYQLAEITFAFLGGLI